MQRPFSSFLFLLLLLLLLGAGRAARAQQVGIGTTAPTQTLDVNGGLRIRGATGAGPGRLAGVAADGTLQATAALASAAGPANDQQPVSLGSVPAGGFPHGVALNPAGTRAYVTNTNDNTVQTYDISGAGLPLSLGTVPTGNAPEELAVNPAGTRLYVALHNASSLQVYDISGAGLPTSLGTVGAGVTPSGLALNAAGTRLYVANLGSSTLQVFDASGAGLPVSLGTVATASSAPTAVALNPGGTRAYVVSADGGQPSYNVLQAFDLTGPGLPVSLGVAGTNGSAGAVLVSPGGTRVYVTDTFHPGFETFDASGSGVPARLGISGAPADGQGGALNRAGTRAYVVEGLLRALYTYDLSGAGLPTPVGSALTDYYPTAVALNPANTRAYVTNFNNQPGANGTLQVFGIGPPQLLAVGPDGSLGSLDPATLPGDNLGRHVATQDLYLSGHNLTGASAATAATLAAGTSLTTPAALSPATSTHSLLPVAYGAVSSAGTDYGSTGNFTVTRRAAGSYRLSFAASPLSSTNLGNATITATLFGTTPGLVSYGGGPGYVDVYTFSTAGAATDRGFSVRVLLP